MDFNKEEAVRAKEIAEKKMESKDFAGALKIALKAQKLHPDLENVSQMIVVCEVHCSAEKKSYGNEKDWYSILKLEPVADDVLIKKQYRKLALVLHPDKNKFPGSSDAFKLIGEAQRVLLDREKRLIYDSRRKAFANFPTPNWFGRQPNARQPPPWAQGHSGNSQFQNNFAGGHSVNSSFPNPQARTGADLNKPTFWTICPLCKFKYQFFKGDVLNRNIICHGCKEPFTAYDFNTAPPTNQSQPPPSFPQQNTARNFTTKPVFEGSTRPSNEPPKPQANVNRKRKKKVQESSESSASENTSESEEAVEVLSDSDEEVVMKDADGYSANKDSQYFGEQPRRSSRPKRDVSYKENHGDIDDDATPMKTTVEDALQQEVKDKKSKAKEHFEPKQSGDDKDDDEEEETEPVVFQCHDPDFSDFDKDRQEESFSPGQIWAVYDTNDAMPRFYAFIRKVSAGFKLLITWLDPLPATVEEAKWVEKDLPISCGVFKRGKNDRAEDLPMFSHLVSSGNGAQKQKYEIYPKTGQTWAVFKNSTMKSPSPDAFEYEFVEILSEYDEGGVRVWYLEKVKGFTCLFGRAYDRTSVILANEKLKFSHMVPSRRMSGEEREGVPKGCFELDPASLPTSVFEQGTL